MQAIADELHESWINGNLSYVIGEVLGQRMRAQTALLAALLMSAMSGSDRTTFLRMLNDKVNRGRTAPCQHDGGTRGGICDQCGAEL